jgi:hypothetical protein
MNWKNGLNFGVAKYQVIKKNVFVPYSHSNLKATIPIEILKNFINQKSNDLVALLKITDKATGKVIVRIKKLSRNGQSLIFSLEKEKNLKEPIVEVLEVKSEKECVSRPDENFSKLNKVIPATAVLPSHTLNYSFPYEKYKKLAPLYIFEYRNNLYCGTRYGRKNLILKNKIISDEHLATVIGLYFAEGGKTTASFTNSQPSMINPILDFIEEATNIKRNDILANIYCHPSLAAKKKNLEDFWSATTGITRFSSNLHLSKNSRSPCGTLELKFCSKILKEFLCGLLKLVFDAPKLVEPRNLVRGIFSAEASPTRQTKNFITHHITLNRHNWKVEFDFINTFISRLGIKLCRVPVNPSKDSKQIHAVVYGDWSTNLKMLLLDFYRFNIFNREKFAREFLSLPQTKLFMELEEGNVITGKEILHSKRISIFEKSGLLTPEQISPKPNKKYEIHFTEKGLKFKKLLKIFVRKTYPTYLRDIEKFYKTLQNFDLPIGMV